MSALEDEPELPSRRCDACGQEERHNQIARYGLGIPRSLDSKLFTTYHVLSIGNFDALLSHFPLDDSIRLHLLPGTRIGNPTFTLLTKLYDFVSKGSTVFISEHALDCVRARGIRVDTIPVNVTSLGSRLAANYYYILPHIGRLMDPAWIRLEEDQCWKCQNWSLRPGLGFPRIVRMRNARVLKSQWPRAMGVIYSKDINATFYSTEFVEACRDAKLTGMGFGEVSWV